MKMEELRDQFAMAALQGLLVADDHWLLDPKKATRDAYGIADAMIEARKTEKKQIPVPKPPKLME